MTVRLPAARPCGTCPYRQDAPAGLWSAAEYAKLPAFDRPTGEQPPRVFLCHQQDRRVCAGWAGCHDMTESLAVRIATLTGDLTPDEVEQLAAYVSPVPLWPTGAAAAAHGLSRINDPDPRARRVTPKLLARGARYDDPEEATRP